MVPDGNGVVMEMMRVMTMEILMKLVIMGLPKMVKVW